MSTVSSTIPTQPARAESNDLRISARRLAQKASPAMTPTIAQASGEPAISAGPIVGNSIEAASRKNRDSQISIAYW